MFGRVSRTRLFTRALAVTLIALSGSWPALRAQNVAVAEVSGNVTDQSGSAVAGAVVSATETSKGTARTVINDAQGRYVLPNLPVGPYQLEVKAKGFKEWVQTGLVLQVGNNVQINASLQVGAVTETVEVQATATLVETKENSISQVIDSQRITELP